MIERKGKNGLNEIYVVGCGGSLKDFDWPWLKDKTTIAVNGSLLDVPQPDYFLTADSYLANRAIKMNFWGVETYKVLVMSHTHHKFSLIEPFLSCFNYRIEPKHWDGYIGFTEDDFSTGQNSGFSAMQLAVILGAKVIHLLGIDMNSNSSPYSNYHHRYHSTISDEFHTLFKLGIEKLKQNNIQVISHSPLSRLNDLIEYVPICK